MKISAEIFIQKSRFLQCAVLLFLFAGAVHPVSAEHHKFFPAIDGWEKPEIDVYNPDNLWDIINGAADLFYAYDFQEKYRGEYISPDDNNLYFVVEIYRQGDPVTAFGVYSQERPLAPELIDIGVQGYTMEGLLNFFAADCYIKIWSHDSSESTSRAMENIARHIAGLLDTEPQFPAIVEMLPEEGKVEFSEQFINTNFLGHPFLSRAFVSTYEVDGNSFNLFIIKNETREESGRIMADYYEFSRQDTGELTEGVHRIDDRWNGDVGIVWKDNVLYGYYNLDDNKLQEKYLQLFLSE